MVTSYWSILENIHKGSHTTSDLKVKYQHYIVSVTSGSGAPQETV